MPSSATACRRAPAAAIVDDRLLQSEARSAVRHRSDALPPTGWFRRRDSRRRPAGGRSPRSTAMNPWSPVPCTVGANRRLTVRTPRSTNSNARFSAPPRGDCGPWNGDRSSSLHGLPRVRAATPEASRKGRSLRRGRRRWSAPRLARPRSRPPCWTKSCLFARWMTASATSAPARMLARSSRSPRRTLAPLACQAVGGGVGPGQAGDVVTRWPAVHRRRRSRSSRRLR